MDSLSQIVLGAAVAVAVTRGKHPRRAILYGVAIGTMPDLDVLQPFENDLAATIEHRTWTHSWIVQALASPVMAALIFRFDKSLGWLHWVFLVAAVLMTHSALDAFTVYGTGLFWPFAASPVMGGSIFIIDPLYTLPLLVVVIMIWRSAGQKPDSRRLQRLSYIGLLISCCYLSWGLLAQQHAEKIGIKALSDSGEQWQQIIATPTPFNSVLWRVIAVNDSHFYEGFYHFLDPVTPMSMRKFSRNMTLLDELPSSIELDRFARFNHGYFALAPHLGQVVVSDLRMGVEPFYFFQFVLHDENTSVSTHQSAVLPRFADIPIDTRQLFTWLQRKLADAAIGPLSPINQRHRLEREF